MSNFASTILLRLSQQWILRFRRRGPYSSGDPLIDFTLGIPDYYEQANDGFTDAFTTETFAYAQDNWKVESRSSDLQTTASRGIIEQPEQNKQFNGLGIVCYKLGNTTSKVYPNGPPGLTWNGDPGCNKAGGPTTHFDHFGPRDWLCLVAVRRSFRDRRSFRCAQLLASSSVWRVLQPRPGRANLAEPRRSAGVLWLLWSN